MARRITTPAPGRVSITGGPFDDFVVDGEGFPLNDKGDKRVPYAVYGEPPDDETRVYRVDAKEWTRRWQHRRPAGFASMDAIDVLDVRWLAKGKGERRATWVDAEEDYRRELDTQHYWPTSFVVVGHADGQESVALVITTGSVTAHSGSNHVTVRAAVSPTSKVDAVKMFRRKVAQDNHVKQCDVYVEHVLTIHGESVQVSVE